MSTHAQDAAPTFDPFRPFVAEDGLEYESLADYLCSRPVACARNDVVEALKRNPRVLAQGVEAWGGWVAAQYHCQNRDGHSYVADRAHPYPQLWDRFAPGFPNHAYAQARAASPDPEVTSGPAGDGGADTGPPAAAAVREAGEPEVRCRVGA